MYDLKPEKYKASDLESRSLGFDPHMRHRIVSLSKTHELPKVLDKPSKRWLRPNMTEQLLTGTLSLNTNKKKTKNKLWDERGRVK